MTAINHALSAVIASWILSGCYHRIPPVITTPSSIRVEGTAAEWRASIPTVIHNPSGDLIQLDWNPSLQQNTNGVWRMVATTFSAGPEPVRVVNPRDSLLVSFVKEESRDMRVIMRRGPLSTGEYRFRFGWWRFENGKEEKGDTVTSSPFVLVVPEVDPKRDSDDLYQALTVKVLDDLKTNWLTPTVSGPNEKGWLIEVTDLDSTRESAFRAKLLDATGGRVANESDTRIEKLTIYQDFIALDSALIYVDRGRVWCQGATVSMVGNVYEYRLLRDYRGWRVRTRNKGMFYDPPPPSDDTTSRCVPSKLR